MIKIGKAIVYESNNKAFLRAPVYISKDTAKKYIDISNNCSNCNWLTAINYPPKEWEKKDAGLWFSVPIMYKDYLSDQRSNAFVVALFWYAMVTESDIYFDTAISKKLYDGLTNGVIPELEKNGHKPIKLIGPQTSEIVLEKKGIVTGMSCGVDSLYTLHMHYKNKSNKEERINYLTFYETGYLFPKYESIEDLDYIYELESKKTEQIIRYAELIAKHNSLPFIHVNSNIDRDYYRGGYIYNAMYRLLACTLILEPMYHKYISASSGHGQDIKTSLFVPSQHYEDILCKYCQTESLVYENSDHVERIDKIREIADDVDFQKYATVCFNDRNCGECYGCWKTIFPLDILGKIDCFSDSFDVKKYYNTREEQFTKFFEFCKQIEADSARNFLNQMVSLAQKEKTDASKIFLKTLELSRKST